MFMYQFFGPALLHAGPAGIVNSRPEGLTSLGVLKKYILTLIKFSIYLRCLSSIHLAQNDFSLHLAQDLSMQPKIHHFICAPRNGYGRHRVP